MMFFNKKINLILLISIFSLFLCLSTVCASDISTNTTTCDIDNDINDDVEPNVIEPIIPTSDPLSHREICGGCGDVEPIALEPIKD